jgi:hypothetical protein
MFTLIGIGLIVGVVFLANREQGNLGKFDRLWRAFLVPVLLLTSYRLIAASAEYFASPFSWRTFVACLGIFLPTVLLAGFFARLSPAASSILGHGKSREDSRCLGHKVATFRHTRVNGPAPIRYAGRGRRQRQALRNPPLSAGGSHWFGGSTLPKRKTASARG